MILPGFFLKAGFFVCFNNCNFVAIIFFDNKYSIFILHLQTNTKEITCKMNN